MAFLTGTEVGKLNDIGYEMTLAAASKDYPRACRGLAYMYQTGEAVVIDYDKSILWFRKLKSILEIKFTRNNWI